MDPKDLEVRPAQRAKGYALGWLASASRLMINRACLRTMPLNAPITRQYRKKRRRLT